MTQGVEMPTVEQSDRITYADLRGIGEGDFRTAILAGRFDRANARAYQILARHRLNTHPAATGSVREAGWVYEYDSGAGWERHVVLNTAPNLPTKRAPTQHYGSPDIRNVQPFYFAAAPIPDAAASEAGEVLDRPALLAAARAWWAAKMPGSTCTNVVIKGDGRVDVYWRDADEDGKYTLPVDFVRAALTTQGGAEE